MGSELGDEGRRPQGAGAGCPGTGRRHSGMSET